MKEKDLVRILNPEVNVMDELLEQDVANLLASVDYVGKITQLKNDLVYVTFERNGVRVTQVFYANELEVM